MAMVIFKKKRDKHGQTRSFFSTFEEKNDVGVSLNIIYTHVYPMAYSQYWLLGEFSGNNHI